MNFRQAFIYGLAVASVTVLLSRPSFAADQAAAPLSDAAIAQAYEARRAEVIQQAADVITPGDTTQGGLVDVAAALATGHDVKAALARLAAFNTPKPTEDMFWAYPMTALMMAGGKNLDQASWQRIQELWRTYWPNRGDTENHWAMSYTTRYLVGQTWPDAGPDAWFNGQSSAENMAIAKAYLLHWMKVTTSHGQGEYDSPNYIEEYMIPMSLLAGWCQDPELRTKARMMIDYFAYDYAVENVEGYYGGAHSRVYPRQLVTPGETFSSALGWYLFGLGQKPDRRFDGNTLLALSGYTPPPILTRIARDSAHRPYVERELKRTRWRMRHAGPHSFLIGFKRTIPVYKYSYVDRDFVLGSSQGGLLQPIQQQTWSLTWRTSETPGEASNTFFAMQPYAEPEEGTMYFPGDWDTVTDLISRSKVTYNSPDKLASGSPYEQVFQHGTALIGLYDIRPGANFSHLNTFFSRDLEHVQQDPSGWIFAQGGPVYIAYLPFAPGEWKPYDWTGKLHGGAGGWIGAGVQQWGQGQRILVSQALKNGYVVQVAAARDWKTMADFEAAVRALPVKFSTTDAPEVTFTALDGAVLHARYGDTPTINGRPVDYKDWPLFDSPFAHEKRGSQKLRIHYGGQSLQLDFTRPTIKETVSSSQP